MKRWMVIFFALLAGCAAAENTMPGVGEAPRDLGADFGKVTLPAPASEETAEYLGLEGPKEPFQLAQVQARLLVVEIFDMYCIYCQRGAPRVNRFYREIQREGLGDQIKVIGLGRKNSGIEVDVFKERFEVEFPLFPDQDLEVTESMNVRKMGTPYFLVLELDGGKKATVIDSARGVFADPQGFLEKIRKHIKQEEE
jgi:hypothetical protein